MADDFEKNFSRLMKVAAPRATEKGMGRAMLLLATDANTSIVGNAVPHDEGFLAASSAIFVDKKRIGAYAPAHRNESGKTANPPESSDVRLERNAVVGYIGYNTPYAARLHENPGFNFREPGTGANWLGSPIATRRMTYMREVARTIKRELKT